VEGKDMLNLIARAHSVLFPVVADLNLSEDILRFLGSGGQALLFGETREEYATGRISEAKLTTETSDLWKYTVGRVKALAGSALLALDADITAVHRLHRLTPALPSLEEAQRMPAHEFEAAIYQVAKAAKALGVNLFLSPTADVVVGTNPWLSGRTLGSDVATVSRLVEAYVRGIRRAGVGAGLKHYPGHPVCTGMPGSEEAHVPGTLEYLRPFRAPFDVGIAAGADAVMMGPAIFDAVTPPVAASISPDLIGLLKRESAFEGLVITCDLDAKATMRSMSISDTAIAALTAGADLLLLSPTMVPEIASIAAAIARAVEDGRLPRSRLDAASGAITALIRTLDNVGWGNPPVTARLR
jgi:beta-N-acetylhexosaminidase